MSQSRCRRCCRRCCRRSCWMSMSTLMSNVDCLRIKLPYLCLCRYQGLIFAGATLAALSPCSQASQPRGAPLRQQRSPEATGESPGRTTSTRREWPRDWPKTTRRKRTCRRWPPPAPGRTCGSPPTPATQRCTAHRPGWALEVTRKSPAPASRTRR
eukprot:scaffold449_cov241-Pinguiococcus_pyrenoidosus.AAC.9